MVPGSTVMYGSRLAIPTLRPRASRIAPSEAEAIPLPSEDTTPPVTNTKRVMVECGNSRRMRSPPENFSGTTTGEQVNTSGRAEVDCLTDQSAALQMRRARRRLAALACTDSSSHSPATAIRVAPAAPRPADFRQRGRTGRAARAVAGPGRGGERQQIRLAQHHGSRPADAGLGVGARREHRAGDLLEPACRRRPVPGSRDPVAQRVAAPLGGERAQRSEEHTSELQSP